MPTHAPAHALHCTNEHAGEVWSAAEDGGPRGSLPPHNFTVYFKEGGELMMMMILSLLLMQNQALWVVPVPLAMLPPTPRQVKAQVDPRCIIVQPCFICSSTHLIEARRLHANDVLVFQVLEPHAQTIKDNCSRHVCTAKAHRYSKEPKIHNPIKAFFSAGIGTFFPMYYMLATQAKQAYSSEQQQSQQEPGGL
eukprot:1159268-Pelagomonas_calceolata.AAC.5